jgi:metallo-beta-lactamase family protein
MGYELFSWGGAEQVTGSKHFLKVDDATLLVDCGAFQGRRDESDRRNREWPFSHDDVDAVLLTHAHYDHCGLLPRLIAEGYGGSIYSTPATRDLANLVLNDSARIQSKDLEYLRKVRGNKKEGPVKEPLYTTDDVLHCMKHFVSIGYHRPFSPLPGVEATFHDAGHVLGSSIAVLEVKGNDGPMRIAFSGDLGRKGLPIIRDPEYIPEVDYLVIESTYGNRLHAPMTTTLDTLAEIINRTVNRGGKILIPAFAIERTQELIFFIHLLCDQGRIPKIPIFVDSPMAVNATAVFRLHEECYDDETRKAFLDHAENPFGFNELHYIMSKEESQKLNSLKTPAMIISSSGMCENGRILHHLAHNIGDSRTTILIVGYMAEHTLGRKILEKAERVFIFDQQFPVNAEVKALNAFSGHADYNEILDYVSHLERKRLKKIFLVHGEKDAQENLRKLLVEKDYSVEIVKEGERYPLKG